MISIEEFKNKIKEHEDKNRNSIKEMYEFFVNFFNDLFTQCEDYFKISAEYLEDEVFVAIEKRVYLTISAHKIDNKFIYYADLEFGGNKISASKDYENKNIILPSESYFNKDANYTRGEIFKNSISRKGNSKIFEELIEELYEKVGERKVFTK
jgi:hypothetical protein